MRWTAPAAVLLALSLAGCQDADEASALAGCKIQRLEKAPNSVEGEYLWPCMYLKGYKFKYTDKLCNVGLPYGLSTCYEPDGDFARIRRNIFGK